MSQGELGRVGYTSESVADVEEGVDIDLGAVTAENRAIFRSPGPEIFPVLWFGEKFCCKGNSTAT